MAIHAGSHASALKIERHIGQGNEQVRAPQFDCQGDTRKANNRSPPSSIQAQRNIWTRK